MPRLSDFPAGGTFFLDANIFLEHILRSEPACTGCFQRLCLGEVHGVTSVAVLAEVRHRLLLSEARRLGYVPHAKRALDVLRDRPELIEHLGHADTLLNALLELPLRMVSVTPAQLRVAQRLSLRHHLLTNDALHLAVMRAHHLQHLATADRDFRRVPRITLWHP